MVNLVDVLIITGKLILLRCKYFIKVNGRLMMNQRKIKKRIVVLILISIMFTLWATPTKRVSARSLSQDDAPAYIVQQGDTLSSIALRFGVSADDLQNANGLSDPNAIQIGQRLIIPGLEGISGLLTSEVLSFGISLTYLSREYQIDREDIVLLNHLISPSETVAGMKFILAVKEGIEDYTPLTTVARGETALEKAIQTGSSPWHLIDDNRVEATWDILAGERLYGSMNSNGENNTKTDITEIFIDPLPAVQGQTLEIGISTHEFTEINGSFMDNSLHFFSEDNENYYSFSGIHAMSEIGPYPLKITMTGEDGAKQSFEQMVLISSGNYGNDAVIKVDDIYVDPATIAEEDEIFNAVVEYTPQKYWEGKFQYPVDEPCINGYFGQRRNYNNGALYYYHTGLDFEVCAPNLNIYAPAAGVIVLVEETIIRGNAILIDHGWGVYSGYWHLSQFNVEVGDMVQPGDLLGIIGDTGRSLGPHLHFEIDIGGIPVNPQTWLEQVYP